MLTFDSTSIKSPREFSVTMKSFYRQNKRNNNAGAIRDFVAVKRVLTCEWPMLTQTELSAILAVVNEDQFNITYPDPELGVTTKAFFVSSERDVTKSLIQRSEDMWEGLSLTFEER